MNAPVPIVSPYKSDAFTARVRILVKQLHQRVPVILISKNEVERVVSYHDDAVAEEFKSPLFDIRNLFEQ